MTRKIYCFPKVAVIIPIFLSFLLLLLQSDQLKVVVSGNTLAVMMTIVAYFGNKLLNCPYLLGNVYVP